MAVGSAEGSAEGTVSVKGYGSEEGSARLGEASQLRKRFGPLSEHR